MKTTLYKQILISTTILGIIFYIFACPLKTIKGMMPEKTQQEKSEFENLPPEILEDIISYLPQKDRIALAYATHNSRPIINNYYELTRKIKITHKTLSSSQNFTNLLQYLANHYITEVNLARTSITDKVLNQILKKVGYSLKILNLSNCRNLQNPNFNLCQNLPKLDLSRTNITDETLKLILLQVTPSLRILYLQECPNLQNPNFHFCQSLQKLNLRSCRNITDKVLNQIREQVGPSLKILLVAKYRQ